MMTTSLFTGVRGSGILRSSLHSYAPVSPGAEVDCAFGQQGLMAEQPSGVNCKSVGGLKAKPKKTGKELTVGERENTELVQQGYQHFKNGDIQGLLGLLSEDVEWKLFEIEGVPFSGMHRGPERVGEFFSQIFETEEVLHFEPREFVAQGDKVSGAWTLRLARKVHRSGVRKRFRTRLYRARWEGGKVPGVHGHRCCWWGLSRKLSTRRGLRRTVSLPSL